MKRIIALLSSLFVFAVFAGSVSAQETYRIKPGDVLRIEVLEDNSINRDALVLPDGRISVPLAGTVPAGGRTLTQVQANIVAKLRPNFANEPTVFVSMARLAARDAPLFPREVEDPTIEIYVLGQVNNPGKVLVAPGTTMLQALAEIGGFAQFAARKRIQLRRVDDAGQERVYRVNYNDILAGRTNIGLTVMAPGDVIIVPERRLFE